MILYFRCKQSNHFFLSSAVGIHLYILKLIWQHYFLSKPQRFNLLRKIRPPFKLTRQLAAFKQSHCRSPKANSTANNHKNHTCCTHQTVWQQRSDILPDDAADTCQSNFGPSEESTIKTNNQREKNLQYHTNKHKHIDIHIHIHRKLSTKNS